MRNLDRYLPASLSLVLVLACTPPAPTESVAAKGNTEIEPSYPPCLQSVGNCGTLAPIRWFDVMHENYRKYRLNEGERQGDPLHRLSAGYVDYWYQFEQIRYGRYDEGTPIWANSLSRNNRIQTGSTFEIVRDLVLRYGLVANDSFAPLTAGVIDRINASLATGVLASAEARLDTATVRRALDEAWQLDAATIAMLRERFGMGEPFPLDCGGGDSKVLQCPTNFMLASKDLDSGAVESFSLASALRGENGMGRWRRVAFPQDRTADDERARYFDAVVAALRRNLPLMFTWLYNPFADDEGAFRERQYSFSFKDLVDAPYGWHDSVVYDYELAPTCKGPWDPAGGSFFRAINSWKRGANAQSDVHLYVSYLGMLSKHCRAWVVEETAPGKYLRVDCDRSRYDATYGLKYAYFPQAIIDRFALGDWVEDGAEDSP